MKWFQRKQHTAAAAVQLRSEPQHPYAQLSRGGAELGLYRAVRQSVPVVDAAIYKLIRMSGGLRVDCGNQEAQRQLADFLRTVPVGWGQYGLQAFLDRYLDMLLTCGRAVGEIVPAAGCREIAALLCGRVEDVELHQGNSPLEFTVWGADEHGRLAPLPYQDLLLFTPLNPETDAPCGVSLLRGLPFMADILMKIYHTIGVNWERCGSIRYAVTCKDSGGDAAQTGQVLAEEWSRAMADSRSGQVRDFVAVGDVDIKVIGGDAPILDSQIPVRQILEQIIAKTGIPPFMLGMNWNSTERMSAQQADMLTTEVTALRRTLTPVVERICRLWLQMHGYSCQFAVVWDDINLQDLVEESKAELYREQARKLRLENDREENKW